MPNKNTIPVEPRLLKLSEKRYHKKYLQTATELIVKTKLRKAGAAYWLNPFTPKAPYRAIKGPVICPACDVTTFYPDIYSQIVKQSKTFPTTPNSA